MLPVCAMAQTKVERQVIGSTGASSSGSLHVTYTVGESVINTLTAPGLILTQGFQQPTAIITGIALPDGIAWEVKHYPNPVVNTLHVEIGGDVQGSILLHVLDVQGRTVHFETIEKFTPQYLHRLQVDAWPAGTYFLNLSSESGQPVTMGFQKVR